MRSGGGETWPALPEDNPLTDRRRDRGYGQAGPRMTGPDLPEMTSGHFDADRGLGRP